MLSNGLDILLMVLLILGPSPLAAGWWLARRYDVALTRNSPSPAQLALRRLQMAARCAVAPLLLGMAIMLAWSWREWDFLIIAGLLLIWLGLGSFAAGMVMLLRSRCLFARAPTAARQAQGWLVFTLLLGNFPAACLCLYLATWSPY